MSLTLLQSTGPGSFMFQGSQVLNAEVRGLSLIILLLVLMLLITALLRLMGNVLVSCRFHSDSGAPEKFIL